MSYKNNRKSCFLSIWGSFEDPFEDLKQTSKYANIKWNPSPPPPCPAPSPRSSPEGEGGGGGGEGRPMGPFSIGGACFNTPPGPIFYWGSLFQQPLGAQFLLGKLVSTTPRGAFSIEGACFNNAPGPIFYWGSLVPENGGDGTLNCESASARHLQILRNNSHLSDSDRCEWYLRFVFAEIR